MKKRLILLVCGIFVLYGGARSGILPEALTSLGWLAARAALSDSPFTITEIGLETGQGYEEGLLLQPAVTETSKESTAPVVNLSINNGKYKTVSGVAIKNTAARQVDIADTLEDGFVKPRFSENEPAVLIYHTHTTESYADAGAEYTDKADKGVLAVGEKMKEIFEAQGLKTIHLTDNFMEGGAFGKAYTRSLAGAEAVLKKYPSIQIVLDIHRDSIVEGDTEYCPLTTLGKTEYAQVMPIVGTDTLGMAHPNWDKNLAYGLSLVKELQEHYPGVCRPLNLNKNRYNTHLTPYTLLVEVGGYANTTPQALASAEAVAKSICEIVR